MSLKVSRITKSTDDSVSLWFAKDTILTKYEPGQHAILGFTLNGQKYIRTYSFHTSPYLDVEMGITVRAVEGGVISNYFLSTPANEIEIELQGIKGDFVLVPSENNNRHLVMFAGGSGITPIFSMIRSVLKYEPQSSISLIYSNRSYSRIIFNSELRALELESEGRLKVYHVITQDENIPNEFPVFYKGRLSKLITKKLLKNILSEVNGDVEYYLCGPYTFMELIEETIRSINVQGSKIHKEHFFIPEKEPAFDLSTLLDREVVLQVKDEKKVVMVKSGKSILQASLEGGINVPYSCTEGQCGTCRAKLLSGEVKLRKNHILTDDELKAGQIILCQAFPATDGVSIKTSV
jgi:ring-1,2-phenylacetyl-CoA epoxidase subunit PaaE